MGLANVSRRSLVLAAGARFDFSRFIISVAKDEEPAPGLRNAELRGVKNLRTDIVTRFLRSLTAGLYPRQSRSWITFSRTIHRGLSFRAKLTT